MSEHDELHQVTAERDFLAGLVEQHEAQLRTFSADLQHVLLAEFSGEDLGPAYMGAWQRLHALIAPVATGYTPTPDEAVPASVARINALAALDQDSSADACPARADPHETYALNVTLSRGDAALFQRVGRDLCRNSQKWANSLPAQNFQEHSLLSRGRQKPWASITPMNLPT